MRDLVMSLASSVVAGSAVWLGQRLLRYRRLARKRAFFGVSPELGCVLAAPRHFSSADAASVHRRDMAALVELATIVNECGGRSEVVTEDGGHTGVGQMTEFSVGGPSANRRAAVHMRTLLPGVRWEDEEAAELPPAVAVGAVVHRLTPGRAEYAVLAKAYLPGTPRPLFVLAGQTARTNLATARFLRRQHRQLLRRYGRSGRFCLVLRVVEPDTYGTDLVEEVADVTPLAFQNRSPETATDDVSGEWTVGLSPKEGDRAAPPSDPRP